MRARILSGSRLAGAGTDATHRRYNGRVIPSVPTTRTHPLWNAGDGAHPGGLRGRRRARASAIRRRRASCARPRSRCPRGSPRRSSADEALARAGGCLSRHAPRSSEVAARAERLPTRDGSVARRSRVSAPRARALGAAGPRAPRRASSAEGRRAENPPRAARRRRPRPASPRAALWLPRWWEGRELREAREIAGVGSKLAPAGSMTDARKRVDPGLTAEKVEAAIGKASFAVGTEGKDSTHEIWTYYFSDGTHDDQLDRRHRRRGSARSTARRASRRRAAATERRLAGGAEERREPSIRVIMMPKDTNAYGTIFGGVILSYIDQAGAVEAHRRGAEFIVTVAMHEVDLPRAGLRRRPRVVLHASRADRPHVDHDLGRGLLADRARASAIACASPRPR